MKNSILGIDIGNYNIKLVEAAKSNGKMEIINYDIYKLPENIINDGKITDIQVVTAAITEMLQRNFIKTKSAVVIISSSSIITREINVPKMKEAELTKYVHIDAQQHFPVDLEEYILDYKILEEVTTKDGQEYVIMLVAVPKLIIADYVKLFERLKLDLFAIDIESNAILKYMQNYFASQKDKAGTIAVIDLGAHSSTVNIFANGVLKFNRMVPHGSNDITRIISDSFNLNMKDAEEYKIKNAEVLVDSYGGEGLAQSISETIKPMLDGMVSSVNKLFEFYHSRTNSKDIEMLILIGGGSMLKGIDGYYRQMFNLPTKKISLTDGIENKSSKPTIQKDLSLILPAFAATDREIV